MSSINSDEIISILREEIENFDTMSKDSEVGTVVAVGDTPCTGRSLHSRQALREWSRM